MGLPELLRVIGEEADREVAGARVAGEVERARVVAEARAVAAAHRDALVARTRAEAEARVRAAREALTAECEWIVLQTRRRHLDALHADARAAVAASGSPALDARLLAALLPEVGPGPFEVVVDPGAGAAARAALARLDPAAAALATVSEAPASRGGVEVLAGRRVLDDTLPSRLERAWPDAEAELAEILAGGERPWRGSTS